MIHEALHSLGFVHEHNRYDRDKYLKIDWKNVDPQSFDVYNKDDPHDHNPYCVSFDPLSIMHYDPYVSPCVLVYLHREAISLHGFRLVLSILKSLS